MNTSCIIKERLTQALNPTYLEIIDNSKYHEGHAGAQNGAGHYHVKISSAQFNPQKRIYNHQLIYTALDGLIPEKIHALVINIVA